jgi:hypothetical protein
VKTRTTMETAIFCAAGVIALAVLVFGLNGLGKSGTVALCFAVLGGVVYLGARALSRRGPSRAELTGSVEYRALAEEYRRLADMAITAQEHTDLKLSEVSVRMDCLREQLDGLQKILSEVE